MFRCDILKNIPEQNSHVLVCHSPLLDHQMLELHHLSHGRTTSDTACILQPELKSTSPCCQVSPPFRCPWHHLSNCIWLGRWTVLLLVCNMRSKDLGRVKKWYRSSWNVYKTAIGRYSHYYSLFVLADWPSAGSIVKCRTTCWLTVGQFVLLPVQRWRRPVWEMFHISTVCRVGKQDHHTWNVGKHWEARLKRDLQG